MGADAMRLENVVVKDVEVKTHSGDFSVKKEVVINKSKKWEKGIGVLRQRQQCDTVMLDNGSMI